MTEYLGGIMTEYLNSIIRGIERWKKRAILWRPECAW